MERGNSWKLPFPGFGRTSPLAAFRSLIGTSPSKKQATKACFRVTGYSSLDSSLCKALACSSKSAHCFLKTGRSCEAVTQMILAFIYRYPWAYRSRIPAMAFQWNSRSVATRNSGESFLVNSPICMMHMDTPSW